MFPVPGYCEALDEVVKNKQIEAKFKHNLKQIKPETKEAIFEVTTDNGVEEIALKYDMIHVTPPMSAPTLLKIVR
jgi:sulfide:quinone oxidoreductase